MEQINIAVIDDGISEKLYNIGELKYNIEITPELKVRERVDYDPFLLSHGTTCAAIIKRHSPKAVLSSLKILNSDSKRGMKAQLICALDWCLQNNIQLVNLSLGTIDFRDFKEIENATRHAVKNGLIIVAACNNKNVFTVPASLKYAIGVKCDFTEVLSEGQYIYYENSFDGVEIVACAKSIIFDFNDEYETTVPCNSYAAPVITAKVNEILVKNNNISQEGIKNELKNEATFIYKENNLHLGRNRDSDETSSEVPIIMIYDYEGKTSVCMRSSFVQMFRDDGYNAVAICIKKSEQDLCNGVVAIEELRNADKELTIEKIEKLSKVYEPDVIITSVHMNGSEQGENYINTFSEIDIKIYILNEAGECLLKKAIKDNKSKSIFILPEEVNYDLSGDIKVFYNTDDNLVKKIYHYMMDLFDKEE